MIRAALILALMAPAPTLGQSVAEPEAYREDLYRAPVPVALTDAVTIDADAAFALWKTGRVAFVDVLPRAPKPEGLPEGTIWRDKPRRSIPGALWLPNVGYGKLADVTHSYFQAGLEKATGADKDHPVVIFCLADCWMSWNAGRRALEYGYTRVFWFPDGTDGWTFEDFPTEVITPLPIP